jgi:N-acetyl-anhydromuramyl-L-alanine amidase AmpD
LAKLRPPIVQKPIELTAKRKQEMVEYAFRHYGIRSATLTRPKVIVEHYTVTPDVQSTYDVFAPDQPDVELNELPGLCSQFVIGRDGTIYQLTPLSFMCRHTVGLNYTALGIEHVGSSDEEILSNPAQMRASLRLTRWLRCRSHIAVKNVIGHNESRSSPYHHENVARLRSQTHADWVRADMDIYRRKLAALGPCPR